MFAYTILRAFLDHLLTSCRPGVRVFRHFLGANNRYPQLRKLCIDIAYDLGIVIAAPLLPRVKSPRSTLHSERRLRQTEFIRCGIMLLASTMGIIRQRVTSFAPRLLKFPGGRGALLVRELLGHVQFAS